MQTKHFGPDEARDLCSMTGHDAFYWRAVRGSKLIARLTSRVQLPDTVELPTDRPVIVAANHSSWFDLMAALITLGTFGLNARIGVNSRFFSNPVAGWFLRGIGCIPFSREDRESAEQAMVDALDGGQACAMMPEGKIVKLADRVDGVGAGRPGISRIARRTGAAILPVGFVHSDRAWLPGKALPRVRLGRDVVTTCIGSPIELDSDDHEANAAIVMSSIAALIAEGYELAAGN
ncbi:MAG: lysophospholipid acyltransferase family protein [Acidimicrobiales bacterium]